MTTKKENMWQKCQFTKTPHSQRQPTERQQKMTKDKNTVDLKISKQTKITHKLKEIRIWITQNYLPSVSPLSEWAFLTCYYIMWLTSINVDQKSTFPIFLKPDNPGAACLIGWKQRGRKSSAHWNWIKEMKRERGRTETA